MPSLINPSKQIAKITPFYYGWLVVLASSTSMFARNAAATLTIGIFVFPMSESLGWSRTVIVGAAGCGWLANIIVSPLIGFIIQKYGNRVVLLVSIFILGTTLASIRWITHPIQFYILFGIGRLIFQSPIQIGATTVVTNWFASKRGRATSILGLSHSVGMGWFWIGISVWVTALPAVYLFLSEPSGELKDDKKPKEYDSDKVKNLIGPSERP
mgnify:CR=1 FL=1